MVQMFIAVWMQGSLRVFLAWVTPLETKLYLRPGGVWAMALVGCDGSSGSKIFGHLVVPSHLYLFSSFFFMSTVTPPTLLHSQEGHAFENIDK